MSAKGKGKGGASGAVTPSKPGSAASAAASSDPAAPATSSAPASAKARKGQPSEHALLEDAAALELGQRVAVSCVATIVRAAMDKLTEHHIQQVAMQNTAKQAIDFVMQAIEWQLLVHDDGEKLTVRKVLADKQTSGATVAEDGTPADAEDADLDAPAALALTPSPITDPFNRSRPAMDLIAAKLQLPTTYNQIWTCEDEPEPLDMDKWARGVIPTKSSAPMSLSMPGGLNGTIGGAFNVVHEADEGSTPRSGASSATPSQSRQGHRASNFRSPVRGGSAGSSAGSVSGSPSSAGFSHHKTRSIAEEKEALAAKAPQPYKLDVSLSKEAAAKEKSRETEVRRLEKKKRGEAEVTKIRAADASERERMERIQQELRHRAYTFDNRGNVILVSPQPVERFPALQATPNVKVKDEFLTDEQEAELAKKAKRNRFKKGPIAPTAAPLTEEKQQAATSPVASKSSDIGLQKKKKVPKVKPDTSGFLDLNATQPSLMETLKLAKGVTLHQGQMTKAFDPRAAAAAASANDIGSSVDNQSAELRGLTRSEYLKRIEQKRLADAKFLPSSTTGTGALPVITSPTANRTVASRPTSAALARPSQGVGGASSSFPPHASTADLGDSGEMDANEVEWGFADGPSREAAPAAPGTADSASYRRVTAGDAFNHQLTHDPCWGQNPATQGGASLLVPRPPAPVRPTEADRLQRSKLPRDRVAAEQVTSQVARKHLAPASFGKTTGHGLEVAGDSNERFITAHQQGPPSPSRSFSKLPPPSTVIATDKAKLYFGK